MLALCAAAAFGAVDANEATQAELESIKGIGPGISAKILDERKKRSFRDWQDLMDRVNGESEGNAARFFADGLTVNGAAFGGASSNRVVKKAGKESPPAAAASAASAAAKR
ncbi:MAG: helix-hairpin-helix domain-containing protein [Burkholderiaceae bacterium]